MESQDFEFKQFTVKQGLCAFKVGTDSVILGSWVDPSSAKKILDIGTGSGVLALMMAQKSNASITAIDLDEGAYLQAKENAENSPWGDRIKVEHSSIQDFSKTANTFDLMISNPPYFINKAHATGSPLSNARNTDKLPFQELAKNAYQLLDANGSFFVVLPTTEAKAFRTIAEKVGFVLARILRVQTKAGVANEKRHLLQLQKSAFHFQEELLVIEETSKEPGKREYTSAYRTLTQDFYLTF